MKIWINEKVFNMFDYKFQLNDLKNELILPKKKKILNLDKLVVHKKLMQLYNKVFDWDVLLMNHVNFD